jgi:hypothetical protein
MHRDAEVKEEAFLEYINQLLMTGEVAGLFPKEELDSVLNDVRPVFKRECIGDHPQSGISYPTSTDVITFRGLF